MLAFDHMHNALNHIVTQARGGVGSAQIRTFLGAGTQPYAPSKPAVETLTLAFAPHPILGTPPPAAGPPHSSVSTTSWDVPSLVSTFLEHNGIFSPKQG